MRTSIRPLLAGVVVLAGGSCARTDRVTAPLRPNGDLAGSSQLIAPVTRTAPLTANVSWTFSAGPSGVVSSNASVGLTITIPAGALDSVQQITVTALAGSPVAYAFAPHLTFAQPVVLTQSLQGTSGAGAPSALSGAHFLSDTLQLSGGLALVDEIVPAVMDGLAQTVWFSVGHFSGYILATGSDDGSTGSTQ